MVMPLIPGLGVVLLAPDVAAELVLGDFDPRPLPLGHHAVAAGMRFHALDARLLRAQPAGLAGRELPAADALLDTLVVDRVAPLAGEPSPACQMGRRADETWGFWCSVGRKRKRA